MTLVGHSGTVRCLHLMGNRLVSGSTDQTLKVWDLSVQDEWSSIACKVTMVGHTDTVRCVQVIKPTFEILFPVMFKFKIVDGH
jgi:F-box/WD-40 domain protein 7